MPTGSETEKKFIKANKRTERHDINLFARRTRAGPNKEDSLAEDLEKKRIYPF